MKHHIIVKLKDTDNIEEYAEEIRNLFNEALQIEGVKKVDVLTTNSRLRNRFDLMIKMDLTKKALEEFDNSDISKRWKENYADIVKKKTVFDCN